MIILSSVSLASISLFRNIRVFGPGLNPFAPYGMANHSFLSP
ncbi:hypothetical protein AMTRI_Chr03g144480 [Amborella trichopoda]